MRGGVIVAGGYSARFGDEDKAVADLDGSPMVRHVADRLAPAIETLVVNGRATQRDALVDALSGYPLPVGYAPDETPGLGPVAGIATGLGALPPGVDRAVVIACDMPFVDADAVAGLFERFDAGDAEAVVPRTADGWYQVLHAVYAPDAMVAACRRALAAEERKVLAPLSYLAVAVVDADAALERSCENVNTPGELERARRRLTGG